MFFGAWAGGLLSERSPAPAAAPVPADLVRTLSGSGVLWAAFGAGECAFAAATDPPGLARSPAPSPEEPACCALEGLGGTAGFGFATTGTNFSTEGTRRTLAFGGGPISFLILNPVTLVADPFGNTG